MVMHEQELIRRVESYARAVGLSPATVCKAAVGNGKLYENLLDGGSCRLDTARKLVAYMQSDTVARLGDTRGIKKALGVDTLTSERIYTLMRSAFGAGFAISGEGFNAEYPYKHNDAYPETDSGWIDIQERKIAEILSEFLTIW